MADSTYAGVLAEKVDAIARQRLAQGLMPHRFLAFMLALNGYKGLPKKYLSTFDNALMSLTPETALKGAKMQGAGQGKEFQFRVLLDASDSFYESPISFADKTNFDATDDGNRLQYEMKLLRTQPAILALDRAEIENGKLGNLDGFAHQVGQKLIKFFNGLGRTLMLGDGTGNKFNGLADHNKALMYWDGETTGTWTSKTLGKLDQDTNSGIKNHAYTTSVSDAKTTAAKATDFLSKIQLAIEYAALGGPDMIFGVMAMLTKSNLATVLTMANQQLLAVNAQWGEVGRESVKVLLGRHIYVEGVPFVIDTFVPANYIYVHNMNVLGLDWKGNSAFKSTGVIDLAKAGTGYPIGSVGLQVEFQGNLCGCLPGAGSVISAFSG